MDSHNVSLEDDATNVQSQGETLPAQASHHALKVGSSGS